MAEMLERTTAVAAWICFLLADVSTARRQRQVHCGNLTCEAADLFQSSVCVEGQCQRRISDSTYILLSIGIIALLVLVVMIIMVFFVRRKMQTMHNLKRLTPAGASRLPEGTTAIAASPRGGGDEGEQVATATGGLSVEAVDRAPTTVNEQLVSDTTQGSQSSPPAFKTDRTAPSV